MLSGLRFASRNRTRQRCPEVETLSTSSSSAGAAAPGASAAATLSTESDSRSLVAAQAIEDLAAAGAADSQAPSRRRNSSSNGVAVRTTPDRVAGREVHSPTRAAPRATNSQTWRSMPCRRSPA